MTSRFATMQRRVSAACDRVYGEQTLIIRPTVASGYVVSVPGEGEIIGPLVGIVDDETASAHMQGARSNKHDRADVAADRIEVSYDASMLDALGVALQQADTIQLLDRAGEPCCRIVSVEDDGMGRISARLMKATS